MFNQAISAGLVAVGTLAEVPATPEDNPLQVIHTPVTVARYWAVAEGHSMQHPARWFGVWWTLPTTQPYGAPQPYGVLPAGAPKPYGTPLAAGTHQPYGAPPSPQPPYGAPPQPYGAPATSQPYAAPPPGAPYGQPPTTQPYGAPHAYGAPAHYAPTPGQPPSLADPRFRMSRDLSAALGETAYEDQVKTLGDATARLATGSEEPAVRGSPDQTKEQPRVVRQRAAV
ncbi:hypothetical protein BJ742DRAFT_859315 [Cladochytrium replicatum]|nr:hypothetical protein BJ742DRAFT_859315 [Cladochytrium replicatum]